MESFSTFKAAFISTLGSTLINQTVTLIILLGFFLLKGFHVRTLYGAGRFRLADDLAPLPLVLLRRRLLHHLLPPPPPPTIPFAIVFRILRHGRIPRLISLIPNDYPINESIRYVIPNVLPNKTIDQYLMKTGCRNGRLRCYRTVISFEARDAGRFRTGWNLWFRTGLHLTIDRLGRTNLGSCFAFLITNSGMKIS